MTDFSSETMEGRRKSHIFQVPKEKNCQFRFYNQWKYALVIKDKSKHSQMKEA